MPLPAIANVQPSLRQIKAGSALFRKGDAAFGLFRLVQGRLRLTRVSIEGAELPVHTVRAGEFFAEAALFSSHYHCDAIAVKDCDVLVYPKSEVVQALRDDPGALWEFAAQLARRLQELRTAMEVRQVRAAHQRVLQALQLRCDSSGCWTPEGTLKQFAEEIGLTHEALYRALARLEQAGFLVRDGQLIRLRVASSAALR